MDMALYIDTFVTLVIYLLVVGRRYPVTVDPIVVPQGDNDGTGAAPPHASVGR